MGKWDIRIVFQAPMNYKMSETDPLWTSDCIPDSEITLRGRLEQGKGDKGCPLKGATGDKGVLEGDKGVSKGDNS